MSTKIDKDYEKLINEGEVEVPKTYDEGTPIANINTPERQAKVESAINELPDTATATLGVDPITGGTKVISVGDEAVVDGLLDTRSLTEILEQDPVEEMVKRLEQEKTFEHSLGDIGDEDILSIINFIKLVEKDKPKKLYDVLPPVIKNAIDKIVLTGSKDQKEMMANEFYNMIKAEIEMDNKFVDLDKAIQNELNKAGNVMEVYLDHQYEVMTVNMEETAKKLDEKNPTHAKLLRDISKTYLEALDFKLVRNKIKNKGKEIFNKQLNRDLKKNKTFNDACKKANVKYKHSKYIFPDTRALHPILDRHLPQDIPGLAIKKFIMIMLHSMSKYKPENVLEHVYMYYTVKSIQSLDHVKASESEISKKILKNVEEIIRENLM